MRNYLTAVLGLLCLTSSAFSQKVENVIKESDYRVPLKVLNPVKSQNDDTPDAAIPDPVIDAARATDPTTEEQAKLDMAMMDEVMTEITHNMTLVDWEYNTNVTDETGEASAVYATYWSVQYKDYWTNTIQKYEADYPSFEDADLKRQFEIQRNIGTSILSEEDNKELNTIVNRMTNAFSEGLVCPVDNPECNDGEGYNSDDLESIMASETDPAVLQYYWKAWRDNTGKVIKDDYVAYIELQNRAAELNDFPDAGIMWLDPYTSSEYDDVKFKEEIEALWQDVKVLYNNLHAYVRFMLKKTPEYHDLMPEDDDPIPAHILGNMWGQSWENIYDEVAPYPDTPLLDISDTLAEKANASWMFNKAESFFAGIGLYEMTEDFKRNSLITDPKEDPNTPNQTVVCHASAWDFYDTVNPREDGQYRIKMCTDTNQEDFIVIHHEMGHIEYQMAYSVREDETTMPLVFRDGANPGFHEAIGDTIALSVSTPDHLKMIQDELNSVTSVRVQEDKDVSEQDINFLMKQALAKVAFLPFAYILDKWRWDAFSGEVDIDVFNRHWWELRAEYQGIAPPVERDSDTDFDIGCKFHVPQSVPYIRYFVAHILQFQFHQKLTQVAECDKPVFNCDIYKNENAGATLKAMLMKGASEPWQKQLSDFMGDDEAGMSASAIKAYFQPLSDFLIKTITEQNIPVGWKETEDILDKWGMGKTVATPPNEPNPQSEITENPSTDTSDTFETTDTSGTTDDEVEIPATVPIVVGIVLAIMIGVVIVAYFIGVSRQKKKALKATDSSIEMT